MDRINALGLERQLNRWLQAGVIDKRTASAIAQFEKSRDSLSLLSWVVGLGVFAIGVGIIALVASNWEGIAWQLKLAMDLLLLFGFAAAVLYFRERESSGLVADLCIGVMGLFVLASMALVGQIYQIDAPLHRSLLTWIVATTPLFLLARSGYLAWLWALAAVGTYLFQVEPIAKFFEDRELLEESIAIAFVFSSPLVFGILGQLPRLRSGFLEHARALTKISQVGSIVGALCCTFFWYDRPSSAMREGYPLICLFTLAVVGAVWALRSRLWPEDSSGQRRLRLALWGLAWLCLVLALAPFRSGDSSGMAALFQFGILALLVAAAMHSASVSAVRFFVALASLRILIAYFELFGSLLDTGVALVGGGIMTVLLALGWRHLVRRWSEGGKKA